MTALCADVWKPPPTQPSQWNSIACSCAESSRRDWHVPIQHGGVPTILVKETVHALRRHLASGSTARETSPSRLRPMWTNVASSKVVSSPSDVTLSQSPEPKPAAERSRTRVSSGSVRSEVSEW